MRKLLCAGVIAVVSLMSASNSSAHVEITSSFPQQFANVNPIPTEVWIEFSGDLQSIEGEIVNTIEVTDSTGLVVSYEDPIIAGGRISTKVSGQSAAGVFLVKYRVVGQDGHVIEGDYTFNASPDYSAQDSEVPVTSTAEKTSVPVGGILLGLVLVIFLISVYLRTKSRRN